MVQVSGIDNALLDDGCWRLTGGGRWGAFSWLFKVIKVILRGFLMFFGFGHWLRSQGLREVGKHARAPGDAMP